MSSSRRVNPWIFAPPLGGVLLVVAVVTSAGAVARSLTSPLGPGLELATVTAPPSATSPSASAAAPSAPTGVAPTATPAPLCGGPPAVIVLRVGARNRENNYLYGLADAIRVARIDFTVPAVSVLTFP